MCLTDDCAFNNGGCSHLCLPTPTGRTCQCATGYILSSDDKSCTTGIIFKLEYNQHITTEMFGLLPLTLTTPLTHSN